MDRLYTRLPFFQIIIILSLLASASGTAALQPDSYFSSNSSPASASATVSITPTGFDPVLTTITLGTPVVWKNDTSQAHTLVSGVARLSYLPLVISSGSPSSRTSIVKDKAPTGAASPVLPQTGKTVNQQEFFITLQPGESYTHTFSTVGTYPYYLLDNPLYTGTVIVQLSTLPPDPSIIAPPLDPTVATTVISATEFLYTGLNPIQTGVDPGTIDPKRVTVLRGHVLDRAAVPIPGVTISILHHPELGQTLTRLDGYFDLVVNGGEKLVVQFAKEGLLPVQRPVRVPWQDYVWVPDVVMIARSAEASLIDLTAPGMQAARGPAVSDADGERQPAVLFSDGTTALVYNLDGSTRAVSSLNVRMTEFTVGDSGPQAMPGELPAVTGYTYAVEFAADEASTRIAGKDVLFNQPVIIYEKNFLDFPTGGIVPVGYYDDERAAWVPNDNGRVVEIVSTTAGKADLDTDGDGLPDNDPALGITEAERETLATLYSAGESLWRTSVDHFSSWDINWSWGAAPGSKAPKIPTNLIELMKAHYCKEPRCQVNKSIVDLQDQALGEMLSLTGAPYSLHYTSYRSPGRTVNSVLNIPLSLDTLPPGLKRIDLEISVAGHKYTQSFTPQPNLAHTFTWDGLDAYGRLVTGSGRALVRVGYIYDGYYQSPSVLQQSFGYSGNGTPISTDPARMEFGMWQEWEAVLARWDGRSPGLGGWSLSPHHVYDPVGRILYYGDGSQRNVDNINQTVSTIAGDGSYACISMGGFNGDDRILAAEAKLAQPSGIVSAADGSYYFADRFNQRIRWVDAAGYIHTVAGGGNPADGLGDGLPATQAKLNSPYDVALGPDGSLYIADTGNNRIRRVGPDGIISTAAGGGSPSDGLGDGGLATAAALLKPQGISVGADGTLYIADSEHHRVRQVSPSGMIQTIVGTGGTVFNGDGLPGIETTLKYPLDAVPGPDGSIYIADSQNYRLRKLSMEGSVTTLVQAGSDYVTQVAVALDGMVYYVHYSGSNTGQVHMLTPEGVTRLVAGGNYSLFCTNTGNLGDDGPSPDSNLAYAWGLALTGGRGGHSALLVSDTLHHRIRKVYLPMPAFDASQIAIPSEDGSLLYRFDPFGRHLDTINTLTGAVLYTFAYTADGTLDGVQDAFGNLTSIERDGDGLPNAVVAPFGQRTELSLDENGYLETVTDPDGNSFTLGYQPGGLLHSLQTPRGFSHSYSYDALGRLVQDQDPDGGWLALENADSPGQTSVTVTTTMGLESNFLSIFRSDGGQNRTTSLPDGTQNQVSLDPDGSSLATFATGMQVDQEQGGDPRFGLQAPYLLEQHLTTPGGRDYLRTQDMQISQGAGGDPFSVETLTQTATLNGQVYAAIYTSSNRTWTFTSPTGRVTTALLDEYGRLLQTGAAGLEPLEMTYDSYGRTQQISRDARQATLEYELETGYLSSITNALLQATTFEYDASGRLVTRTLPGGSAWGYTWDANGNLIGVTEPDGSTDHSFSYTANDRLESYTSPLGGTDSYDYDLDGRLVQHTLPSGASIEWLYNANGQLAAQHTSEGDHTLSYDPTSGLLSGSASRDGQIAAYSYDGGLFTGQTLSGLVSGSLAFTYNNNLLPSQFNYPGASLTLTYDNDRLLTGIGSISLERDPDNGLLSSWSDGAFQAAFTYNPYGEPATRTFSQSSTLYQSTLSYDALGRLSEKVETVGGATHTWGYTYDAAGQLATVSYDDVVVESYTYSSAADRLSMENNLTGVSIPPGGYSYDDDHKLLAAGSVVYTYDADGRLHTVAQGATTTISYNSDGTLASVQTGGHLITYQYDAYGRRATRSVDGARTHAWLYGTGLKPLAEYDGSGNLRTTYFYASGPTPVKLVRGGATYHIVSDPLGSPRLVIDADGTVIRRLDYDSYGNLILDSNPAFDLPFGFAGGMSDPAHELLRFGARDYQPSTGRWTAKDPIRFAGGDNLYAYVANDPLNRRDRLGLESFTALITNPPASIPDICPVESTLQKAPGDFGIKMDLYQMIMSGKLEYVTWHSEWSDLSGGWWQYTGDSRNDPDFHSDMYKIQKINEYLGLGPEDRIKISDYEVYRREIRDEQTKQAGCTENECYIFNLGGEEVWISTSAFDTHDIVTNAIGGGG